MDDTIKKLLKNVEDNRLLIDALIDDIDNIHETIRSMAKFLTELGIEHLEEDTFQIKTKKGDVAIPIPVLLEIEKYLGYRLEFMAIT